MDIVELATGGEFSFDFEAGGDTTVLRDPATVFGCGEVFETFLRVV